MRKQIGVIALSMIVLSVAVFAADDLFTGTWREISERIIKPNGEGISIQQNGQQIDILHYGKDTVVGGMVVWNMVRVDGHTLKTTVSSGDTIVNNITETVSPDGKHYTEIQERERPAETVTKEYERVGSAPAGDAFFGTWRLLSPLETDTVKVDGDMLDIAVRGGDPVAPMLFNIAIRLDGKESKIGTGSDTAQAKRINAQTIEISRFGGRSVQTYQVNGGTLMRTDAFQLPNAPSRAPDVTYFERIK